MMGRTVEVGSQEENGEAVFYNLQPSRDPQLNFELDLAKKLEDYLLKICSGEVVSEDQDNGILHPVNFAEAALLLQGSVQVYSRKVEYLYTLVVHALEFIKQKRQDHRESPSKVDNAEINVTNDDREEEFLNLDDVPEEPKICLDNSLLRSKYNKLNNLAMPPANLLVLEGDCLDTSGSLGELDSYLLSTCNFYEDFLLLDPRDAVAVDNFVKAKNVRKEHNTSEKGRGSIGKSRRKDCFFSSPNARSERHEKSSTKKKQDANINEFAATSLDFDNDSYSERFRLQVEHDPTNYESDHEGDQAGGFSDAADCSDDDEDDPWKPLNPHEPGNLKVKPFKKGKIIQKKFTSISRRSILSDFPLAKLDGSVNPKFCNDVHKNVQMSQSPPLFEKLRQSFVIEEHKNGDDNDNADDENIGNEIEDEFADYEQNDFEMPQFGDVKDPALFSHEKEADHTTSFNEYEPSPHDDLDSNTNLEDLCRSHLDNLLASIAETETQTELTARVSTWKQRIEHTLDEQESHAPFDIHLYGEKVLNRLSTSGESQGNMCFTDIVSGQEKHEIARMFSAMLQLVNDRSIDLERRQPGNESVCYTAKNPFYVRPVDSSKVKEEMQVEPSNGIAKSSMKRVKRGISTCISPQKSKRSFNVDKGIIVRTSPRKKKRLKS